MDGAGGYEGGKVAALDGGIFPRRLKPRKQPLEQFGPAFMLHSLRP